MMVYGSRMECSMRGTDQRLVTEDSEAEDSEMEELSSEEEARARTRVASDESSEEEEEGEEEEEEEPTVYNLGRFVPLSHGTTQGLISPSLSFAMLSSWFGSKSSRHSQSRRTSPSPQPAPENAKSGPSDASSVSQSLQTPGNLTSPSDVPLDEIHAHVNEPSVYARTPSLIHSAGKDTGTLRTPEAPTVSLEAPTDRVSRLEPLERTPFTPQDAVLAQVFGKSVPMPATDRARGTTTPPPAAQPSVSMTTRTTDSLPPPPSTQTAPAPTVRTDSRVTVYDPFSGARLGEHSSTAGATAVDPFNARLPTAGDDHRLWSSLERISELQAEIAAMHADMEGVGRGVGADAGGGHAGPGGVAVGAQGVGEGGRVGPRKRSRRDQTLQIGDEEPDEHSASLPVSEISTEHSEGEEGDDDDDDDDVRGFGKRRRDGEFARLAEQFAQRKTAIGGILNKLDDLSMALKTFHTLPPPLFDLAVPPSRSGTLSSSPSNASAPPSSPPPNFYPRRSSSPLSSISPLHIGNPVTPPTVSLSLPVPPMSTLASPVSESVSSEDLDALPKRFGGVVAPVLPQTILPGTPRVESPTDVIAMQSVF